MDPTKSGSACICKVREIDSPGERAGCVNGGQDGAQEVTGVEIGLVTVIRIDWAMLAFHFSRPRAVEAGDNLISLRKVKIPCAVELHAL